MATPPDPPSDPTEPTPPTGAGGSPSSGTEGKSAKRGIPVFVKLLLGCLVLVVALGALAAVAVGVGGYLFKRGVESTVGSVGDHASATAALMRLEREHPFAVPEDGIVSEAQALDYFAATERAWEDMEPWADDLAELRTRSEGWDGSPGARPGLRDAVLGALSLGGVVRARLALADALEVEGMSLGEYVWTGVTLAQASGTVASAETPAVRENRRLAERFQGRLPSVDEDSGAVGPGAVLMVATLWGVTEASTWSALGLDTLVTR